MTDYALSGLAVRTAPAAGDYVPLLVPTDTTTPPAGAGGSDQRATLATVGRAVTGWADLVRDYGADPSGVTSASTALASACSAAVAAQPASFGLTVPPGAFTLTASQELPYNLVLRGAGAMGGTVTGQKVGTIFKAGSSFTGSHVLGVSDNAGHTSANGAILSGFTLDGSGYTASAVDGMLITGPAMLQMKYVKIVSMSGNGINSALDASASEVGPYGQDWLNVEIDSCAGNGVVGTYFEDSRLIQVYVIGCGGDGWQICGWDNSIMVACSAEWNGGHGYRIMNQGSVDWTYATGYLNMVGCTTDRNTLAGYRFEGTWQTGQGAGTGPCGIKVSSPVARRDTTYSYDMDYGTGIPSGHLGLPVWVSDPATMPGIGDGGAGTMQPPYAIHANNIGTTVYKFGGTGMLWGTTGVTSLAGTHTNHAIDTFLDQQTGNSYDFNK